MTLLELINRVRRRLREDQVSDLTDDYSQLLVELCSDIHREVIEAHDWTSMDTLAAASVTAETGSADWGSPVTDQSLLQIQAGVWWKNTGEADEDYTQLTVISLEQWGYMFRSDPTQLSRPLYIAFQPDPNGDATMDCVLYPTNDVAGTVQARWHVPETPVSTDTDEDYEFEVPAFPVYLGTLYMALNERGEELGEPGAIAERRYQLALATAKEADMNVRNLVNEYEFYRD